MNNITNIKSKKKPFIITSSTETANELKKLNFTLISEENEKYMFLNDANLKFDENGNEVKLNKMCYTNVMCMQQS